TAAIKESVRAVLVTHHADQAEIVHLRRRGQVFRSNVPGAAHVENVSFGNQVERLKVQLPIVFGRRARGVGGWHGGGSRRCCRRDAGRGHRRPRLSGDHCRQQHQSKCRFPVHGWVGGVNSRPLISRPSESCCPLSSCVAISRLSTFNAIGSFSSS